VKFTEVRDSSLMLHWQAPLYIGAGPITGYYVDMCEEGTEEWKQINKQSTATTHMKVCICTQYPSIASQHLLIPITGPAGFRPRHREMLYFPSKSTEQGWNWTPFTPLGSCGG